jgi:hypothetical protein
MLPKLAPPCRLDFLFSASTTVYHFLLRPLCLHAFRYQEVSDLDETATYNGLNIPENPIAITHSAADLHTSTDT